MRDHHVDLKAILLVVPLAAVLMAGCAGMTRITSNVSGASVSLNGSYIGTTPMDYVVKDIWGSLSVYSFTATKDGYSSDTKVIREENFFLDDARRVIPPHIHFELKSLADRSKENDRTKAGLFGSAFLFQDGSLRRETSRNYRYAKETLHLCGSAEIQGYS